MNQTIETNKALGLQFEEAAQTFAEHGITLRITKRDGQATVCTRDYRTDRLNVVVENGVITEIRGIG